MSYPTDRIHYVAATMHTDHGEGDPDFERVEKLCRRLERYARRLGFEVMYENVDQGA